MSLLTGNYPREIYLVRDAILRHHGYKSYQEFLQSEYWQGIKEKVMLPKYRDTYNKCRLCKQPREVLHHMDYRYLLTKYELRSIAPLCTLCHTAVHEVAYLKKCKFRHAARLVESNLRLRRNPGAIVAKYRREEEEQEKQRQRVWESLYR